MFHPAGLYCSGAKQQHEMMDGIFMAKANQYQPENLYFSERISEALSEIWDYPLTILEGPMGYGKSTAVKEFLNKAGVKVLWQTVHDGYASTFWNEFSSLFREIDADLALSLAKFGVPDDSVSRQEAVELIEDKAPPQKTVIVIDDYYLINHPAIHHFLFFLTRNQIANLYIILITRLVSFDFLDELKLKGYAYHITKEVLKLTPDEIAAYYRLCGIRLKPEETKQLFAYTEGWISALYLLMLGFLKDGQFELTFAKQSALTPDIYYLVERAVYDPFSDEAKDFLLQVFIFDSFTFEQAEFMWQKPDTEAILSDILVRNAFLRYDLKSKTYQMHYMMRDFLNEKFSTKDANFKNSIYCKAAEWYQRAGDYLAAMKYFYAGEDFDALLTAFEHAGSKDINGEHKTFLIKHLEGCPEHIRSKHHLALLIYALLLFTFNERELFQKTCAEFIKNIHADRDLDEKSRKQLLGELELILSFTKYNDIKGMSEHHQKAFLLMSESTAVIDETGSWTFGSPSVLYMFYRESGLLKQHVQDIIIAMPYYYKLTHGHGNGAEYVMQAEWHYNRGDFENTEIVVNKALYAAQAKNQTAIRVCAMFLQMRLALLKGDFIAIRNLLQNLRGDILRYKEYIFMHILDLCESFIYLSVNQTDQVPAWVANGEFQSSRLLFPSIAMNNLIYGKFLLVKKDYDQLIGLGGQFNALASIFPNLLAKIYNLIHLAGAYERTYRRNEALQALREALEIAMPDEVYMPFVENCDFIKPLLEKLYRDSLYRKDITKIFELYTEYRRAVERIIKENSSVEKPQLSEHELEIAQLAAEGLTNKAIGAQLLISENTVKAELKSIFEKLGIKSRTLLYQALRSLN
jgi:LuxR family maltose regulon positive regulatory protein